MYGLIPVLLFVVSQCLIQLLLVGTFPGLDFQYIKYINQFIVHYELSLDPVVLFIIHSTCVTLMVVYLKSI